MSPAQVSCYFGSAPPAYEFTKPIVDVGWQFQISGGTKEIDLTDVLAIFYICGMSPYDFIRLGEGTITMTRSQRRRLLSSMLGTDFYLSKQIGEIRRRFPACKHFLIGRPLGVFVDVDYERSCRQRVAAARMEVEELAGQYLFDGAVMPPAELLSLSLLSTKNEFFVGGRQESEVYQRAEPTTSDYIHVNKNYGNVLLRTAIRPIIDRLGDRILN